MLLLPFVKIVNKRLYLARDGAQTAIAKPLGGGSNTAEGVQFQGVKSILLLKNN
jgi:hypothetical protein